MLQADEEVEVQIRIQTAPQLEHTLLSPQLKEQVVSTLAMQTVVGLIRLLKHDGIKPSYRILRLFAYQTQNSTLFIETSVRPRPEYVCLKNDVTFHLHRV